MYIAVYVLQVLDNELRIIPALTLQRRYSRGVINC
jgi:hypothetical protein